MSAPVEVVRQRVATRLGALVGWTESRVLFDVFGRDPNSIAHLAFAVGMPRTQPVAGRQRPSTGVLVTTTLVVRFTARLRPMDAVPSVDDAIRAEAAAIATLMARGWAQDFELTLVDVTRTATDAGDFLRHELTFNAYHILPLE